MIKAILCSNSEIKNKALKKWLKYKYKYSISKITNLTADTSFKISPEQPVDIGGITSCHDRIRVIEKKHPDELICNKYIVSIENSLSIEDDKIYDVVNVVIKNLDTNLIYADTGSKIEINIDILDKYPKFMDILNEFIESYKSTSNSYVFNGCEKTLGSIINKYYPEIPEDNWMKIMCNKDRLIQIFDVLKIVGDNINYEFV